VLTGVHLAAIERPAHHHAVILTNGDRIVRDTIVAGIGAIPEVNLAQSAGLTIENGIAVDETLRTSDIDIFAASDCCSFPHALYGYRRVRLEAWRNAQEQAIVAAHNLMGASKVYEAVPWFWSDQYDLTLQIAGFTDEGRESIVCELGGESRLYFHLAADGRLVAVGGIGPNAAIARDVRHAELLISRRAYPSRDALATTNVRLKTLLVA
jgi:3-phenylpropionate/trans-cinnamate dioxygenase ferredoxin reductase subunit